MPQGLLVQVCGPWAFPASLATSLGMDPRSPGICNRFSGSRRLVALMKTHGEHKGKDQFQWEWILGIPYANRLLLLVRKWMGQRSEMTCRSLPEISSRAAGRTQIFCSRSVYYSILAFLSWECIQCSTQDVYGGKKLFLFTDYF